MKLTPLDIHHKEFRHSLRGYSEEEVDGFLDEVADEFERLFKENIDLSEKLEVAREQVRTFDAQKETLHNTMLAAQRSAEDIIGKAREESLTTMRDAELKAKEVIHNALTQKQKVAGELIRIKQAEEEFRARFKAILETHMRSVSEIVLPDDVSVLMGETDSGMVGEVEVAPARVRDIQATTVMPTAPVEAPVTIGEPPASGFVQSVTLGEVDAPDLGPDDPDFSPPKEFKLSSFGDLGERDDDMDIEEID